MTTGTTMRGPQLEERDWYFTFGFDHRHPKTGGRLDKSYVRINGTADSTRQAMMAAFGRGWSMQYSTAERAGIERFGLVEIPLPSDAEDSQEAPDEPTVAADVAAIRGMVKQLRLLEREHARQPDSDLWDAAEAVTAEIEDRLRRIEALAGGVR